MALAQGLKQAGYDVRVATHGRFESLVRGEGLDFYPMAGDPRQVLASDDGRRWVEERRNPVRALRAMVNAIRPGVKQILDDHWEAARDADVVLYHGLSSFAGYSIAEKRRVPGIPAQVFPSHASEEYPLRTGPGMSAVARAVNRVVNRSRQPVGRALFWQFSKSVVNDWRRERLDLPPLARLSPSKVLESVRPWVYGFSEHVLPRGSRWPSDVHVTGYWFLDRPSDWQPPDDLVAFLAAGSPPIYVGFGSMVTRSPTAELATVVEALRRTGQRAVLVSGYGGLDGHQLPSEVFVTPWVPLDWLFARVTVAVHHGGCGTTALSLRAGLPTVTAPFFGDQRIWSHRVAALRAGPAPIPHAELTSARLAEAIESALYDAGMRARAEALGERLRAEDGVGRAVEIIDAAIQSFRNGTIRREARGVSPAR